MGLLPDQVSAARRPESGRHHCCVKSSLFFSRVSSGTLAQQSILVVSTFEELQGFREPLKVTVFFYLFFHAKTARGPRMVWSYTGCYLHGNCAKRFGKKSRAGYEVTTSHTAKSLAPTPTTQQPQKKGGGGPLSNCTPTQQSIPLHEHTYSVSKRSPNPSAKASLIRRRMLLGTSSS